MHECPICEATGVIHLTIHPDFKNVAIYQCEQCTHLFAYPEPSAKWLESYYENLYSEKRRQYYSRSYFEIMRRRANAQLDFIKSNIAENLDPASIIKNLNMCDIGCGLGTLVSAFQKEGARAVGYDSDPLAIEIGKSQSDANIYVRTFIDESADSLKYDLISLSHVIEHLPNIRKTLPSMLHALRPGGHIFIEVPNCFPEMFDNKIDMESHLHFFSLDSLSLLIEKSELKLVARANCGPTKWNFLNSAARNSIRAKIIDTYHSAWNQSMRLLGQHGLIKTVYDGFYRKYYTDQEPVGIWLRCLAKKGE